MNTRMNAAMAALAAALGFTLLGCDGDSREGGAETPESPPGGDESAPSVSSSPEYAFSCNGEISKTSLGLGSISPRCVADDDGAGGCDDPCSAQAIEVYYEPPASNCMATSVYAWDGAACKAFSTTTSDGGLRCRGSACESVYGSEAACRSAHEQCTPR